MRNEGFNIEYDIVNTINGKKFIDLPHNLYHMVKNSLVSLMIAR